MISEEHEIEARLVQRVVSSLEFQLRDLSVLSQSVVDVAVRPLVDEAIRAFSGGAHRSAVVAAWIAVAVDLTNKVRTLAEAGDGEAKRRLSKVDDAIASHNVKEFLIFENELISVAEDVFSLLDHREASHLRRLYDDRNSCAHPGFAPDDELFVPTAEAVRAHLVAAHDAVFSKQAIAGVRRQKLLIDELQGESWPQVAGMPDYLESRFFKGASVASASNMTKLLIKSAIVPPLDCKRPNQVAGRARLAAVARRNRNPLGFQLALEEVLISWEDSGRLSDAALVRAVGAFGTTSEFWEALPKTALERANSFVTNAETGVLVKERFFASGRPLSAKLAALFETRLKSLDEDDLVVVFRQTREYSYLVPRLLDLIGESDTFETAGRRMNLLSTVSPSFKVEDVTLLQKKIVESPSDQIRPARDVEEALIDAFRASNSKDLEVLTAWRSLASELVRTTDARRYFGNRRGAPYEELDEAVNAS